MSALCFLVAVLLACVPHTRGSLTLLSPSSVAGMSFQGASISLHLVLNPAPAVPFYLPDIRSTVWPPIQARLILFNGLVPDATVNVSGAIVLVRFRLLFPSLLWQNFNGYNQLDTIFLQMLKDFHAAGAAAMIFPDGSGVVH